MTSSSITQFAMVEELAFLIKDNLPCKHLLLSLEEALIHFLEDDTSRDGVLQLEPMNPYHRLLAHRLAEIFGFSHESVGEGEDRHLVLERCEETTIPSILVSDLIWQFDDEQSTMSFDVLRRKEEVIQDQKVNNISSGISPEEREAAYFAARARIFSDSTCENKLVKQRPRHNPVVAHRMITHALGQTNKVTSPELSLRGKRAYQQHPSKDVKSPNKEPINSSIELEKKLSSFNVNEVRGSGKSVLKVPQERNISTPTKGGSGMKEMDNKVKENYLKKEHMGAAKRLFANALGVQPRDVRVSKSEERKKTNS